MGQFEDGQNRLNGSYPTATYYFSNGGITDEAGRPCIVTTTNDATHQFQCDENSPGGPTLGFSIASNGSILFNNNSQFFACPYVNEYNIYTQWLKGQDKCRPIKLSTNSTCAAGGSPSPSGYTSGSPSYSAGHSIPAYPVSSATVQQSVPGTAVVPAYSKSSPVSPVGESPAVPGYGKSSASTPSSSIPIVPGYGEQTPSVPATSVETSPVNSSPASVPSYGSETTAPVASVPGYGGETSTVVVPSSPIESSPVQSSKLSIPGYGGETSVPAVETSVPFYSTPVQAKVESQTVPGYAPSVESSVPAGSASTPAASVPGYAPSSESSVPVKSKSTPVASVPAYPATSSGPVESSPVESTPAVSVPISSSPSKPADVTITQTVYTSDCETTATEVTSGTTFTSVGTTQSVITSVYSESVPQEAPSSTSAPGVPGYGISTPAVSSPVESETSTQSLPTSAPQESTPYPVASSSSSTPQISKPVESSPAESTTAVPSYPAQSPSTAPSVSTSTEETTCIESTTVPAGTAPAPSASTSCIPAGSSDSQGRYSCNPAHQYPAGQTCVLENGCYYLSTSSSTVPSAQSTTPASIPATSEAVESTTCTESVSSAVPTTFATSSAPTAVNSVPSSSVTSAPSTTIPSTPTSATACQTSLEGAYQTPHLITWVSKDYPDKSYGSELNATINEDCSTLFNFDIPSDYAEKQCSVVFLFPEQSQLETSAWSWNEQGSIEFSQLDSAASEKTTYNTCPAKASTLDTIAIKAGNSYVVSTGPCKAGETVTIEASSVGGLGLEFFEDWNPSSLGVYITAC
ncbi:Putative ubiquitin 3 binding protein But2 [Septoria linicola]|uniref:Ubiquitin 3 binding protein But2 n=1 Tax=Septoria linicola TaxID=215465 RepID=A0A9Q9EFQ1_9PEZI|nr:Putative ubiquitin 3 binding protein But2 [Septoria linicola]